MQKARPGIQTKMRMAAGGAARGAEIGVGPGTDGDGGVSKVAGNAAESGVGGEISELEIRGFARRDGAKRAGRGCVSHAREGMAGWATRIR